MPPALQGKRARSIIQFLAFNCTPSARDPKLQVSLFVALLEALPCEDGDEDDSQLQFANPVLAAVRAAALLFLAAENDSLHAQQVWNACNWQWGWLFAVMLTALKKSHRNASRSVFPSGASICAWQRLQLSVPCWCVSLSYFDCTLLTPGMFVHTLDAGNEPAVLAKCCRLFMILARSVRAR